MSGAAKGDSVGLDVNIMGREYRIACKPDEQAELLEAVAFVDRQMREVRDGTRQNNAERIAVMVALNIAHDLLRARSNPAAQSSSSDVDLEASRRRIKSMQSAMDASLAAQEKLL